MTPCKARQAAVGLRPRTALVTLPDFRHPVQAEIRLGVPPTRARTRWMLGFQRRLDFFWEKGTRLPNDGFFPQTSHTAAIGVRD